MANTFNVGDVVRLKSGGPPMTVQEVDGDNIWCIWFDEADQKGGQKGGNFIAATLEPSR